MTTSLIPITKIEAITRKELEDKYVDGLILINKLRKKISNQKKHLRWFNRKFDNFNAGVRRGRMELSFMRDD